MSEEHDKIKATIQNLQDLKTQGLMPAAQADASIATLQARLTSVAYDTNLEGGGAVAQGTNAKAVGAGGTLVDVERVEAISVDNVGKFVIEENYGAIVMQQDSPPVPNQTRQQPPRAVYGFLNRTTELSKLEAWIAARQIVLLYGPDGIGKSALLRQAANTEVAQGMPNGVILIDELVISQPKLGSNDLIQSVFNALYESNPQRKVDLLSARTYLSNTQPLILLDQVNIPDSLQKALLSLFPKGSILISTDVPFGGKDFQRLAVQPLPRSESIALLANKAELELNSLNHALFDTICTLLNDVSLAIVVTGNVLSLTKTPINIAILTLTQMSITSQDPVQAALDRAFSFAFSRLTSEEQKILSAAAQTPGVSMNPEWLSLFAMDESEADALIGRLKAIGLLVANSPLRIPPGFRSLAQRNAVLSKDVVMSRLIEFLMAPLAQDPQNWKHIQAELGNLLSTLDWAAQTGRSEDVIQLGRAIDNYLILRGLWDAWGLSLSYILDAARKIGDQASEGWALHQIGTRAIGVGETNTALETLRQALEIRRSLGDHVGMSYTQHNIDLLVPPPPSNPPPAQPKPPKPKTKAKIKPKSKSSGGGGCILFVLIILAFLLAATLWDPSGTMWKPIIAIGRSVITEIAPVSAEPDRPSPLTKTLTPTPTRTATIEPAIPEGNTIADSLPTLTRTATVKPISQAQVSFTTDTTKLISGQCTNLYWSVKFATSVSLNDKSVGDTGQQQVCPPKTTKYILQVQAPSGNSNTPITINVIPLTPTPTFPPPDKTGPKVSKYAANPDPSHYFGGGCGSTITTFSAKITDPSGFGPVTIVYSYGKEWHYATAWSKGGDVYSASIDNDEGFQAQNTLDGQDGTIFWHVEVTDNLGNSAKVSEQYVTILACPPP